MIKILGRHQHGCAFDPRAQEALRKSKFVFAVENSVAYDYVTEKYFQSLEAGSGIGIILVYAISFVDRGSFS